jgi:hypothetical protein
MRGQTLRSRWLWAISFALSSISSVAAAADLADPPSAQWGCELSDQRVLQGIMAGLLGRGWTLTSNDNQGNLVAQVIVRGKHTLVVDIAYTTTSYDITYKSSDNLDYQRRRNGSEVIHRNANSWMSNIQNDIAAQLALLCAL